MFRNSVLCRKAKLLIAVMGLGSLPPRICDAQRQVYFLPGIQEQGTHWASSAQSLASTFSFTPQYNWAWPNSTLQEAAAASLGTIAPTSVLIGHSNGGLVARLRAQSQNLAGVVTYGTPNSGMPLRANAGSLGIHVGVLAYEAFTLALSPVLPRDAVIVAVPVALTIEALPVLSSLVYNLLSENFSFIGGAAGARLVPNSDLMQSLESGRVNELSHVSSPASVVFTSSPYGGAFKLLVGEAEGIEWGNRVQTLASALIEVGATILLNGLIDPPEDTYAIHLANLYFTVGFNLFYFDDDWCRAVNGVPWYYSFCGESDNYIPVWSQELHGVPRFNGFGTHTFQVESGVTYLTQYFLGLPPL